MKIGMLNLLGSVPTRLNSHNAGWTLCLASIIKQRFGYEPTIMDEKSNFEDFKFIVINNGVNYKENVWNFFGGVSESTLIKLDKLKSYMGSLVSFNEPINFNTLLNRKEIDSVPDKEVTVLNTWDMPNSLTIGDSHSLSIYDSGGLKRIDGKTLHGFLKDPFLYMPRKQYSSVTFYFGNIDIRFHVCRFGSMSDNVIELANKYTSFANNYSKKYGCIVNLQGLLPIEDESRKIPGTGMYKGKPYYGTQTMRDDARILFNSKLEEHSKFMRFYYLDPWLKSPLSFDDMEARQSVHVRPSSYKYAYQQRGYLL